MSTQRSYRQHCGVARALDVLGDRWSLLIVRELLLGPRRYGDLATNLPGIGTNLLAARLRSLDEAGVLHRTVLPAPANVPVYELTDRGERLRPLVEELALWGFELLPPEPTGEETMRVSWAAMSMGVVLQRGADAGVRGTFAFVIGDEVFHVIVGDDRVRVRQGVPASFDVRATTDPATFIALAEREITTAEAVRGGLLEIDGDRRLLARLFTVFRLPVSVAA